MGELKIMNEINEIAEELNCKHSMANGYEALPMSELQHLSLGVGVAVPGQAHTQNQSSQFYGYERHPNDYNGWNVHSPANSVPSTAGSAVYAQSQMQTQTQTNHGHSHRQEQYAYGQHQQHQQQHQYENGYAHQNGYTPYRSPFRGSPKGGAVAKLKLKKGYHNNAHNRERDREMERDRDRDRNRDMERERDRDRDRNGMEPRRAQRLGYYWDK